MDARGIVDLLRRDGHDVRWIAPCPGGEFGASFVDLGDRPGVLKWWTHTQARADRLDQSTRRITNARSRGYPAPEVVGHGRTDDWLWHLQERAPGSLVDEPLSQDLVDQLIAANGLAVGCGIGEGDPWGHELAMSLREGLEDWCIHSVVAAYSRDAETLLGRVLAVGSSLDADAVPSGDLVHGDFHHRNMLVTGGRVTAIIDIEACQDGDRRFDLVTLGYWLGLVGAEPGVVERLAELTAAQIPIELLAAYRAHMVLRNLDFYARTGRPELVDLHIAYGASVLAELGV